ncbi:hypothetical protein B296_00050867, partial [Ensete ventricosum]
FDALHMRHKEHSCLRPLVLTELGYHLTELGYHLHEPHDQPTPIDFVMRGKVLPLLVVRWFTISNTTKNVARIQATRGGGVGRLPSRCMPHHSSFTRS